MDFDDIYSKERKQSQSVENSENSNENHSQVEETKERQSIYDSQQTAENQSSCENAIALDANCTFSATDKKLSYIGNDSDFIPTEIIYQFGLKTLILDISFNLIKDLRDLIQFPYLEELICDNNEISEESNFPKLDTLKIFSCNKNKINDIHVFIDKIKVQFPNLTYLSLLGNKACPNQLIDPNKDEYDYSRYRKYVLYRLKKLKFLDCYEVTKEERDLVANDSLFMDVVTPDENNSSRRPQNERKDESNENYTPLTALEANNPEKQENQGSFGYCRYIYYGKQSEGNRFIRNDDL